MACDGWERSLHVHLHSAWGRLLLVLNAHALLSSLQAIMYVCEACMYGLRTALTQLHCLWEWLRECTLFYLTG